MAPGLNRLKPYMEGEAACVWQMWFVGHSPEHNPMFRMLWRCFLNGLVCADLRNRLKVYSIGGHCMFMGQGGEFVIAAA